MSRNILLITVLVLLLSTSIPSSVVAMPTHTPIILPDDCRILAGKEMQLTLDGFLPPNGTVSWNVTMGAITSVMPGRDATFVAPSRSSVVTISAFISPALPGMERQTTRQCIVTLPQHAPKDLARVTGIGSMDLFLPWIAN